MSTYIITGEPFGTRAQVPPYSLVANANLGVGQKITLSLSAQDEATLIGAGILALYPGDGTYRGSWQPNRQYFQNDVVLQAGSLYEANVDFTSGSSFNAANWTLLSGSGGSGVSWIDVTKAPYNADNTGAADSASAFRSALAAANTQGGGVVWVPHGTYKWLSTVSVSASNAVQIWFETGARINFPSDIGVAAGDTHVALDLSGATTYPSGVKGGWFVGPGAGTAKMSGIRLPGAGFAEDTNVTGFYAGLYITQDHERAYRSRFQGNQHGIYFANGVSTSGDQKFELLEIDGNAFSSVAVAGTGSGGENIMTGVLFDRVHFGSPYCIAKLTPIGRTLGENVQFIRCAFEGWGNAIIGAYPSFATASNFRFESCAGGTPFNSNAGAHIVANPQAWCIDSVAIDHMQVVGGDGTFLAIGSSGIFSNEMDYAQLDVMGGLIDALGTKQLAQPSLWCHVDHSGADCTISNCTGTTPAVGDLVEYAGDKNVKLFSNTANRPVFGVALQAVVSQGIPVALSGPVTCNVAASNAAIAANQLVKADPANNGKVAAAQAGDPNIVGIARAAVSGGAGPTTVNVLLWDTHASGAGTPVSTRNVTGATALAVNPSGGAFIDTLTGNTTYSAPTGPVAGTECSIDIKLVQDATGSRTVTWFSGIVWASGLAPTIPAGAGQQLYVSLVTLDGGVSWIGSYAANLGTGILATHIYNPGSASDYVAGTSSADADAVNLVISFTAPVSGNVLVTWNGVYANVVTGGPTLSWSVREGGVDLATEMVSFAGAANTNQFRTVASFLITGLTPGSVHTYKWGQVASIGSSGHLYAGGSQGAAVMKVEAA